MDDGRTRRTVGSDTIRTTNHVKAQSNPTEMFEKTVATKPMSNGRAVIVDSMAMRSWETFAPELSFPATAYTVRNVYGSATSYRVTSEDPYQEDYSYLYVNAGGGLAELDIFLPRVQSTTYDIYCVFAPAYDKQTSNPGYVEKPNRVIFRLNYCNARTDPGKTAVPRRPDATTSQEYRSAVPPDHRQNLNKSVPPLVRQQPEKLSTPSRWASLPSPAATTDFEQESETPTSNLVTNTNNVSKTT